MKAISEFASWISHHPLKASLFWVVFTALAVFAGCRDDLLMPVGVVYALVVFVFAVELWKDTRPKNPGITILKR